MSNWSTILAKDLRMIRTFAIGAMIGIIIVAGLLLYWGSQAETTTPLSLSTAFSFLFTLLWPTLLWIGWSAEWKGTSALWLQLPGRGWRNLSSKLLASLIFTVPILILVGVWYTSMLFVVHPPESSVQLPSHLPLSYDAEVSGVIVSMLLIANFYIAMGVLLMVTIMKSMQTLVGGWRWVIGLAISIAGIWVPVALGKSPFYHRIWDWGAVTIRMDVPTSSDAIGHTHFAVYTGDALFFLLVMAIIFAVSSWLFDRRIEV